MEERDESAELEDVNVPEDAVEDLAPEGDDSEDVKGGKAGWPMKFQGPTIGS